MKPLTKIAVRNDVLIMKLLKKMLLHDNSPPKTKKKNKFLTIKSIITMKTFKLFIAIALLITINSFGQLDKKTWLVGGTGSFDSYKENYTYVFTGTGTGENIEIERSIKEIEFSPKVGYFVIDKLALGIGVSYISEKSESKTISGNASGGSSKSHSLYVGPFARYYFLNKDKPYNILVEANYQFGNIDQSVFSDDKGKLSRFSLFVGPEIYFNSSVGMNLLVGYTNSKRNMDNNSSVSNSTNGLQVAIGFQIYLQKN